MPNKEFKRLRGGILISRMAFVKEKYGEIGVERIRSELIKRGYHPPDPRSIKLAEWYPNEYNISFLKVFRDIYGEKSFIRMSKHLPFESVGFVRHFVKWPDTPEELITNANKYWRLFYDFGTLEGKMTGEREGVIYGKDVSDDPVVCDFLTYYFEGLVEKIAKSKVTVSHEECVFRGGDVDKWLIKW